MHQEQEQHQPSQATRIIVHKAIRPMQTAGIGGVLIGANFVTQGSKFRIGGSITFQYTFKIEMAYQNTTKVSNEIRRGTGHWKLPQVAH